MAEQAAEGVGQPGSAAAACAARCAVPQPKPMLEHIFLAALGVDKQTTACVQEYAEACDVAEDEELPALRSPYTTHLQHRSSSTNQHAPTHLQEYAEDYDLEEDEELEGFYFSSAAGRARVVLGNRRYGAGGFISGGHRQVRAQRGQLQALCWSPHSAVGGQAGGEGSQDARQLAWHVRRKAAGGGWQQGGGAGSIRLECQALWNPLPPRRTPLLPAGTPGGGAQAHQQGGEERRARCGGHAAGAPRWPQLRDTKRRRRAQGAARQRRGAWQRSSSAQRLHPSRCVGGRCTRRKGR